MENFYKNHQNLSKKEGVLGVKGIQIKPSNDQGRSMVEMLGVLAIIGVLSIGAISGYRYAMNKYRANQTVNELNLLSHQVAIAMMSKNGVSGTLTLGESYDANKKLTSSGYNFAYGCGDSGVDTECSGQNAFHFEVKDVSEGVCKELTAMMKNIQYMKQVLPDNCVTSDNNITFVFEVPDAVIESETTTPETPIDPIQQAICSGNGLFLYGKCACDAGYNGSTCEIEDTSCSGNGTLNNGVCTCNSDHYGKNCQFSVNKCEKNGIYESVGFGYCYCSDNFGGEECEVANLCNGYGHWESYQGSSYGKCVCTTGHYGADCGQTTDPCGAHGSWNSYGAVCECDTGYEGAYCDQAKGTICKHGTQKWHEGMVYCQCDIGWMGPDCNTKNDNCKNYYTDSRFCASCLNGYGGKFCDAPEKCPSGKQWYNGGWNSCR